jgi:ABC-type nickel/cobalt efflux system permease component RcnA
MSNESSQVSKNLLLALSTIGGIGITLMIVVAGVGVVEGANADSQSLNLYFGLGSLMLVGSCLAWFAIVRPDKNFDDINQALEEEAHH